MLREKTQRRLFRLLFVLGCLLPTLAIAGWAFVRFHPAFKAMVFAEVSRQAGVTIDCESFNTPRPNVYQIVGLEIHDPYTEQLLCRADQLTAQKIEDVWELTIGNAWIENPSASSNKQLRLEDIPLALSASLDSLTIGQLEQSLVTWNRVKLKFDPAKNTDNKPSIRFTSYTESNDPDTQIVLSQCYDKGQLVTKLNLDTGNTPLVGELIPHEDHLSDITKGSLFVGTCEATQKGDQSVGSIRGKVQLAEGELGPRYGNWQQANIELHEVKWTGMMVTRFKGEIDVRHGKLSRPIIWVLNDSLNCQSDSALKRLWEDESLTNIPFDQLACDIEFDYRGLILVGKCKNLDGDRTTGNLAYSILARRNESLLKQPEEKLIPLWSVLQALWPNSPAYVPVSSEAQKLARLLPFASETSTNQ